MTESNLIPVLVVEDHQMFGEAITAVLEAETDIRVIGVATSLAEMKEMMKEEPQVVLMDYNLPDGTGVEGTNEIRKVYPKVKVVMVTAEESDAILSEALMAGCSGYVNKTASISHLSLAVRTAAQGSISITPDMLSRLVNPQPLAPQNRALSSLSRREMDILKLLSDGLAGRAIAEDLGISTNTVRNHIQNILDKLGAHSKLEAVSIALRAGIIQSPK